MKKIEQEAHSFELCPNPHSEEHVKEPEDGLANVCQESTAGISCTSQCALHGDRLKFKTPRAPADTRQKTSKTAMSMSMSGFRGKVLVGLLAGFVPCLSTETTCDNSILLQHKTSRRGGDAGLQSVQEAALAQRPTYGSLEGIALADFDGDGVLDQFLCNHDDMRPNATAESTQRLLKGTSSGAFEEVTSSAGLFGHRCSGVAAADLDNDGDTDLVTALYRQREGSCKVWLNDGTGSFTELPGAIATASCPLFPGSVALADVNNDGKLDAYIGSFNDLLPNLPNHPSSVLIGDGTGNFALAEATGAEFPEFPCVASFMDLDDDGDQDIVVATCNKLTNNSGAYSPYFDSYLHLSQQLLSVWKGGVRERCGRLRNRAACGALDERCLRRLGR